MHLSIPPYLSNLSKYFQEHKELWQQLSFSNQESLNSFANFLNYTQDLDFANHEKLASLKTELESYFSLQGAIHFYIRTSACEQKLELALLPNESYFVFSSSFLNEASENELRFELSQHFAQAYLYQQENFSLHTSARISNAILNDYRSPKYYRKSAENFLLYEQSFCDYASASFLKSPELASSIIAKIDPSNTFRLEALHQSVSSFEKGLSFIQQKLSEHTSLENLDVFEQDTLQALSAQMFNEILKAQFTRTPKILKLVKTYSLENIKPGKFENISDIKLAIDKSDSSIKEYLAYLLLDLLLEDEKIYTLMLYYLAHMSALIGLKEPWLKNVKNELNLSELMLNDQMKEAQVLWKQLASEDQNLIEFNSPTA